jgi:formylglycine-generating enzyme required for sulfatase activity
LILVGLVESAMLIAGQAQGQPECPRATAFRAVELEDALASGAPASAMADLVRNCGTAFPADDEVLRRLRRSGATDALVKAIQSMSPTVGASPGSSWRSPRDDADMLAVPPGTFQMGSRSDEAAREVDEGQHPQRIDRLLWVDATEVTNQSYRKFVLAVPAWQKGKVLQNQADTGYLKDWRGTDYPAGRDMDPVRHVSWHAARAFAAWAGKRLPTEAEWEYVARSGTSTAYWWGDTFDPLYVRSRTAGAVHSSRLGPWRLRDTLGSVWEWTSSLYRPYPYVSNDGRESNGDGPRVVRGGSLANASQFLRAANRSAETPALTSELLGFRCVR